ncbi:enoyl-CoA hydratase/isomerase family protein [Hymenobacter sp. B1770]|uniref:enoyl-CoA hydratase/isomerase family protein n=1 Tax=Hymenobacter sp. B1770 TaxID=1718788 RepID=UPI003CF54C8B
MTNTSTILAELRLDGILCLTINRIAQLNALSIATMNELEMLLKQAQEEEQVRAILLTGAGEKAFVAGADIGEFTQLDASESRSFAQRGQRILRQLEAMSVPVLAAINGFALGGGCELALACHLRVASEKASLGLPEVKLGIIPGYGGTQRLTQLVGRGKALELMLTGNPVPAAEALRIGLVNHVVSADQLLPFSLGILQQIVARAPIALAKVIEAVAAAQDGNAEGYNVEARGFESCCHSADFREGVAAFLEKRPAAFDGR